VNKEVEDFGCKVLAQYAVLGQFDFVTLVEADDSETAAHLSVDLGSRGTVAVSSVEALSVEALRAKLKGPKQLAATPVVGGSRRAADATKRRAPAKRSATVRGTAKRGGWKPSPPDRLGCDGAACRPGASSRASAGRNSSNLAIPGGGPVERNGFAGCLGAVFRPRRRAHGPGVGPDQEGSWVGRRASAGPYRAGDKVGGVKFDVSSATGVADPGDVPGMMVAAASELAATNLVVYLVDFEQRLLEPIRDQSAQSTLPEPEEVGVSVAGRAFVEQQAQVVERDDGTRVWVPIIEGSDPTGVLALTVPAVDEDTVRACQELGVLAGYLIATHARVTDL
jgi:hypothetical protein